MLNDNPFVSLITPRITRSVVVRYLAIDQFQGDRATSRNAVWIGQTHRGTFEGRGVHQRGFPAYRSTDGNNWWLLV